MYGCHKQANKSVVPIMQIVFCDLLVDDGVAIFFAEGLGKLR